MSQEEPTLQPGFGSGLGDMLGGVGNMFADAAGIASLGLLPDHKGKHEGPLAPIVQALFGDDPMAAESWHKAVEPPPATSPFDPDPTKPGPTGSAPPSQGQNPGETAPIRIVPPGLAGPEANNAIAGIRQDENQAPGITIAKDGAGAPSPEELEPQQTDGTPEANARETARLKAAQARANLAAEAKPGAPAPKPTVTQELMDRFRPAVWGPNNPPPTEQDRAISMSNTPGRVNAVTTASVRTFDGNGYGNTLKGAITVNGHTYNFVSGGRAGARGSAPFGEYQVGAFTSGAQRAKDGYSYQRDAFPLSDAKDNAPGVGGGTRTGLLIHDASNSGSVTAGCIGILGGGDTFARFQADMKAEQAKNGGKVTLNLGPNKAGGDANPMPSVGMNKSKLPGDIASIVDYEAQKAGLPVGFAQRVAEIESSGNPDNTTGSYKGLFQLSESEFKKYGGTGSIYDPTANARAGLAKIAAENKQLAKAIGREPTPGEMYLAHQQGVGGATIHIKNPNQPAWQSMYQTAEGRAKGANWAKQAIWGNVPDSMKKKFGSVDNLTSGQFAKLWDDKINRR